VRKGIVTAKEMLQQVLLELPQDRLGEVLDFARFLNAQEERETWGTFGRGHLARAYGSDEPEYTEADLRPELES
jgi:hypothetical protein